MEQYIKERWKDKKIERKHKNIQMDRMINRKINIQKYKKIERQKDGQIGKQKDRKIER